jgi:hypothetical protein
LLLGEGEMNILLKGAGLQVMRDVRPTKQVLHLLLELTGARNRLAKIRMPIRHIPPEITYSFALRTKSLLFERNWLTHDSSPVG